MKSINGHNICDQIININTVLTLLSDILHFLCNWFCLSSFIMFPLSLNFFLVGVWWILSYSDSPNRVGFLSYKWCCFVTLIVTDVWMINYKWLLASCFIYSQLNSSLCTMSLHFFIFVKVNQLGVLCGPHISLNGE